MFIHKLNLSLFAFIFLSFLFPGLALAASISVSPSTGVYTTGSTFNVAVVVNTQGKPINAAEGTIKFNPNELSVVSLNKSGSIFNLWVAEPSFSNTAGTISFSGGLPSGYTGSVGTILNVTFRTKGSGPSKVSFTNGSVLANDGKGTNVLSGMSGGTYTIQAVSSQPVPEVIEYVAPANTPGTPQITSDTHPESGWSKETTAILNWTLPSGVTAVRTLLDGSPSSIPTKVYETPIRTITLSDLDEGVSYFHLQFRNADGWGKVKHYRLAVDTKAPEAFTVSLPEEADLTNPIQTLLLHATDTTSGVNKYLIKIDEDEPFEYEDEEGSKSITLPELEPGYHSFVIEAFDGAGNSLISTFSFTILAFERPVFTEYPDTISEDVIPVIRGLTRPNSVVEVFVEKIGSEPKKYELTSDNKGVFTLIPEGTFSTGVYELTAQAVDQFGAKSELSDPIRMAVQRPGFVRIGSMLVDVLSVVIPLIAMLVLLVFGFWYLIFRLRRLRRRVTVESREALDILAKEFTALHETLRTEEEKLISTKRSKKLNKSEEELFADLTKSLVSAQSRVEKEITDVNRLVQKKESK